MWQACAHLAGTCYIFTATQQCLQESQDNVKIPEERQSSDIATGIFVTLCKSVSLYESESEKVKVTQSCPTLWDPMDSTLYGILQARIVEWVAIPFSRASSHPREWSLSLY